MPANTNTDLRDGVNGDVGCKYPCLVASMVNIDLEGTQTINGIAVVENDIALVNAQDDPTENGVYVVSTGQWQRGVWFNNQLNVSPGSLVATYKGTQRSKTIWQVRCDDNPIQFGTSEIFFDYVVSFGSGALLASNNLGDVDSVEESQENLGLEIGEDVQAQNDNLQSISELILAANKLIGSSGLATAILYTIGTASGNIPQIGSASATEVLAGLAKIATQNTVNVGTNDTDFVTALKLSTLLSNRKYESPQQTIILAGQLVLPHGLPSIPKYYFPYLVCTSDNLGYFVDQETPFIFTAGDSWGVSIIPDATNLTVRYGFNTPTLLNASTGAGNVNIDITKWKLIIRAFL